MEAGYTARHLSVLEGLEAVRKRPGMYIGSTDSRGLMHCLWEIVDNGVDEALAGHCDRIEVELYPDGSIEVRDNGRGIPVDIEPKSGLPGVELVYTKLHAGGKFGGGSYGASGGLHGVGASVVNALSARLDVQVDRDGHIHEISFRRGVPGVFDGDGPTAKFKKKSGLRDGGKVATRITGTRVRFWVDKQIFLPDAEVSVDEIHVRLRQTAFLVPGLTLVLIDSRQEERVEEEFHFDGGISEFTEFLARDEAVCDVLRLQGVGHFHETVPVLDDQGHMTSTEVERELTVDVAVRWGKGYESTVRSFVNVIATPKGGTHVTGFERALVRTLNEQLRETRLLKNGDDPVNKEDISEGLTAVVTVRVPEPQFEGQTKEVLGTSAATRIVSHVVSRELKELFANPPRGLKQQLRATLEKIVAAAKARIAAREHRENQRRKSALENSALPAKLVDCRSDDIDRSELFIVEGDSALGTAKLARDSEFQALLPIRGKILNVQKASVSDMLKNAECAAIIQVVGAGLRPLLRPRLGPLRQDHPDGRRRRRRRAHPLPAAHPVPPLHASHGGGGSCVRRRASAAPHRAHQSGPGQGQVHLLLLRRRAAEGRCATWSGATSGGRTRCSATRAWVRWTPTSSPRPPWTRATASCAASASRTSRRRRASSAC